MKKILFLVVSLLYVNMSFAQLPDSLKKHIDSGLNIMQIHSLYAGRINWDAARLSL